MRKTFYAMVFLLITALLIAGCSTTKTKTQQNTTVQQNQTTSTGSLQTANPGTTTYTLSQVSKHNRVTDCWMAISGNVYDVTSYVNMHPGGPAIIQGCGKDATALYSSNPRHNAANLDSFYIGKLA